MDKQIADLETRVAGVKQSVAAAHKENHRQLQQRIDAAHAEPPTFVPEAIMRGGLKP